MLAGAVVFTATIAITLVVTFALWVLNYAFDGVDLVTWLEEGAWKIPAIGGVAAVGAVVVYTLESDANWQALTRRCAKLPKLLRKSHMYPWLSGLADIGESTYPITVAGTEQGILLRRPWKNAAFLPWDSVLEIRVDWSTHSGKLAELHLPNYDARSFVVAIPWNQEIAWWVPERIAVWHRGSAGAVD